MRLVHVFKVSFELETRMCTVFERLVRVTTGWKYRTDVVMSYTAEAVVCEVSWRPHHTPHGSRVEKCDFPGLVVNAPNITPTANAAACGGPSALVIVCQWLNICGTKQGGRGGRLKNVPPRALLEAGGMRNLGFGRSGSEGAEVLK